ncbi:hypothetical protein WIS52_18145 [Pseudonocardia nematodicida]|uniref:Uncharacterized protein n=1 Tax=Pseudonocardia nematodicida TaxID=1206997 RepID=A0ABV1KDL4_9PSEU
MTLTPDEENALTGEARELGGQDLVDDLGRRATRLASTMLEWDGIPPVPPRYRAMWFLCFRQILESHKAGEEKPRRDPGRTPLPAPPEVTSEDGRAALAHERALIAETLLSALDTLTDTELRSHLAQLAAYLRRLAHGES